MGSRYIDWLVPGLLGMNIMSTGLWGLGFSIVTARTRKLLKRLVASPMSRRDYLLAQLFGRLVFLVVEVGALLGFSTLVFGVPIRGSLDDARHQLPGPARSRSGASACWWRAERRRWRPSRVW